MRAILLTLFISGCGADSGHSTFHAYDFATAGGGGDLAGSSSEDLATSSSFDLAMSIDFAQAGPVDLAMNPLSGQACGAIFDCVFQQQKAVATCAQGKPAASINAYNAIFTCVQSQCGNDTDDAGATMPCNGSPDLGTQCNDCFQNTLIGGIITWQDAQGNPLACVPASAPECGHCTTQQDDCIAQCFGDADCASLICNTTMMPPTCMGSSGTTPGQCGC